MQIKGLRPPRLRTVETESERSATWLELFYDLAFVVAVAVLGSRLSEAEDFAGIASFAGYFLLIWWLWASHTFYADRYDTDDLAYRILATVQLAAVAIIAASLSAGPAESSFRFAVGYTIARVVLLVMYWRARRHVEVTRRLVNGYLVGFGLGAAFWAVSIFAPEPLRFGLWSAGLAIDLATPWVMRKEQALVPLDVSHLPERFGLFTILVLGESIAATVFGLGHVEWAPPSTFAAVMALVVATALWWLYFDNVEGMVVRRDPNAEHDWRPTVWIYSHLGIGAGLVMVAIGLEHAILEAGHEFASFERWLLLGGAAVTSAALGMTHLASGSPETYKLHNRVAYTRFVAAGAMVVLGLFSTMSSQALVLAMATVLIATAVTGVRASTN
jgi:low temperature requirement protein LtrA